MILGDGFAMLQASMLIVSIVMLYGLTMSEEPYYLKCEGRIIPEVLEIGIHCPDKFEYSDPSGHKGIFDLEISDGLIKIEVELATNDEELKKWAIVRGHELAVSIVDLYAFTLGYALITVIDATVENDVRKPFIPVSYTHLTLPTNREV